MSTITISELNASGIELFDDSESFLYELSEEELNLVDGGATIASNVQGNNVSIAQGQTVVYNAKGARVVYVPVPGGINEINIDAPSVNLANLSINLKI
jgi:hypothetical protein